MAWELSTGPAIRTGTGNHIIFSANGNLWQIDLSSQSGQVTGDPWRLTAGSARELYPAALGETQDKPGLTLAFASLNSTTNLWSLPLDANTGKVRGEARKITQGGVSNVMPTCSADGKKLAFAIQTPSNHAIPLRDMTSGKETTLVVGQRMMRPKISPDGSRVAYHVEEAQARPIYLIPATGGEARKLCDDSGSIYGWEPGGQKIIYWSGSPIRFFLLDPDSQQKSELVAHPKYNIHSAELSPDCRWVAFHVPFGPGREPVFVAPIRDGKAAGESDWITVVDNSVRNLRPWWSPDGNLLYLISKLDGFSCIWAQRLESATKRPVGSLLDVYHFHGARRTLPSGLAFFGPAVSPDRIVFSTSEVFGNVWMANLEGQR